MHVMTPDTQNHLLEEEEVQEEEGEEEEQEEIEVEEVLLHC
jgi:hypothetical protein